MSFTVGVPRTELNLLQAIETGEITWRQAGRGTSYRFWVNEDHYVTVTDAMRKVGPVYFKRCMAAGYNYVQRGYLELTPAGRERLRDLTYFGSGTGGS